MADRPILFSAPMIRALLAGRKTQTRRVLKPQPAEWRAKVIDITKPIFDEEEGGWGQWETEWSSPSFDMPMGQPEREVWRPLQGHRYATGDRLWVRETWADLTETHGQPWERFNPTTRLYERGRHRFAWFRADGEIPDVGDGRSSPEKWLPSIFMPRWASRITLVVTDVRVQRLQEISEEDAIAEGVPEALEGDTDHDMYCCRCQGFGVHAALGDDFGVTEVDCTECDTAVKRYRSLWERINGPGSWETNPWVAAYSFTVALGNIDQVAA